jgi:hypothetical protein
MMGKQTGFANQTDIAKKQPSERDYTEKKNI